MLAAMDSYPTVEKPTFTQWLKWKLTLARRSEAVCFVGEVYANREVGWPTRSRTYTPFVAYFTDTGRSLDLIGFEPAFKEYERDVASGKPVPTYRRKSDLPHRDRRSFTILPETFERVQALCDVYDPPISQGAVIDKALAAMYGRRIGHS